MPERPLPTTEHQEEPMPADQASTIACEAAVTHIGSAAADLERTMAGLGAWLEIDLDAIAGNLAAIRARTGSEIMPVIKNNAYGHGLRPIATALAGEGVRWMMVAKLSEALAIQRWDLGIDVVAMDALYTDAAIEEVVRLGVTPVVYTRELAERIADVARGLGRKAGIFVKVDTGLRRVGVAHDRALGLFQAIDRLPEIEVRGTFSTFMQQEEQDRVIFERFSGLLDDLARAGIDPGLRSLSSTHGILHYPHAHLDLVRPAMCLFGVLPFPGDRDVGLTLTQALELKARVEFLKPVPAGASVTYFGKFIAPRDMTLATLHVGFFDALPRELANKGVVLAGDRVCPSVGSVSLNHYLFDATDSGLSPGDIVTVIARQGVNDLVATASAAGWMVYSLVNHLSPYLPRVYLRSGAPVEMLTTGL